MRLTALSNERLDPWVNWTTLGPPLLRSVAAKDGARLIAPPPLTWANLPEWSSILKELYACDTLFWMQASARPELPVLIASLLRGKVRRSAFVIDAWRQNLAKIGALASVQRLNPCFVAFREAYEELRARFPRARFEWLPFGVDTDVFSAVPGARPIFAFWMGRRHEPLHQAMLQYCSARGLDYRYTRVSGEFSPVDLGSIAGRSKYFIVAPPDLANPDRTGGFSPFVMRYLEGLSAGARLLGVLPRSGEYEMLLPLDAILQVAPDGSDLHDKLDSDSHNVEAWAAVERAQVLVRTRHSWATRAEQIYERLSAGSMSRF